MTKKVDAAGKLGMSFLAGEMRSRFAASPLPAGSVKRKMLGVQFSLRGGICAPALFSFPSPDGIIITERNLKK